MKIFNMYQADIFVQKGCTVERILKIDGKQCIQFVKDEVFEKCMKEWQKR